MLMPMLGAGDQLLRKDMSEAQREQLTAILEDIYEGFTEGIALSRGRSVQEVCVINDSYLIKVVQACLALKSEKPNYENNK